MNLCRSSTAPEAIQRGKNGNEKKERDPRPQTSGG
jgi:hypothetical protein